MKSHITPSLLIYTMTDTEPTLTPERQLLRESYRQVIMAMIAGEVVHKIVEMEE